MLAKLKVFALLFLAGVLSGCASVQLERKVSFTPADVVVVDNRTPQQRAHRRDSTFSAVAMMADDRFTPRAVDLFVEAVHAQAKAGLVRPIKLDIDDFRVVDFFPVRLGAGGQGWLGHLIFQELVDRNTDWSFVDSAEVQRSSDSLICVFVGRINGAPVKVATSEAYRLAPLAGLVVNDPDFRRALDAALQRAASQALAQLR